MLTNQGPKVLEFNARFGDPECQAILMRLKSDLLDALEAVVDEKLDRVELEWDPRPAVTVVMASEGYPGHYERGRVINNLEEAERMADVKVFHAGTSLRSDPTLGRDGRAMTDGGRVLGVTALGDTLAQAQARAYEATRAIRFNGAWYRRDIADRASSRARPACPLSPPPGRPECGMVDGQWSLGRPGPSRQPSRPIAHRLARIWGQAAGRRLTVAAGAGAGRGAVAGGRARARAGGRRRGGGGRRAGRRGRVAGGREDLG